MMEMTREMAIGKIHRAVVTGADLHYVGSITVDEDLLDAANMADRRPRTSSIRPQRRPLRTFWYKTVHRLFAWIHIY